MKKKKSSLGIFFIVSLVVLTISGCSSSPNGLRDPLLTWQDHAMIYPITINRSYPHASTTDDTTGKTAEFEKDKVGLIPPGTRTLKIYVHKDSAGRDVWNADPVYISQNFQSGERYVLTGDLQIADFFLTSGTVTVKLLTVDEYRSVYTGSNEDFQTMIVGRFNWAENEFKKNKIK